MPTARSPEPSRSTCSDPDGRNIDPRLARPPAIERIWGEFGARLPTEGLNRPLGRFSRRFSSWRPARPVIVGHHPGDSTCASSTAISSIFRATIRAGWRNITACSGPSCASSAGFTSSRPPSAGPRSRPTTRSRPGPSIPRQRIGRPARPTISSGSRISSSRTWRRRSGARSSARCGSTGGWSSPAPSAASARRTGVLQPSSPIRI